MQNQESGSGLVGESSERDSINCGPCRIMVYQFAQARRTTACSVFGEYLKLNNYRIQGMTRNGIIRRSFIHGDFDDLRMYRVEYRER